MIKILITIVILCSFVTSCATPYQRLGVTGGYSDIRLSKDTYKVSFRGNASTSQEEVQNYLLRRSADLTLQNGYKYFLILTSKNKDEEIPVTTPTKVRMNSYGTFNGFGNITGNTIGNNFYGNMLVDGTTQRSATGTIEPGKTYISKK